MRKGLALLIILLVPSIAPAHHSRAEFRGVETVEIEGVLTKIIWRNGLVNQGQKCERRRHCYTK